MFGRTQSTSSAQFAGWIVSNQELLDKLRESGIKYKTVPVHRGGPPFRLDVFVEAFMFSIDLERKIPEAPVQEKVKKAKKVK